MPVASTAGRWPALMRSGRRRCRPRGRSAGAGRAARPAGRSAFASATMLQRARARRPPARRWRRSRRRPPRPAPASRSPAGRAPPATASRLAREDERQRDGPVEQVGAAVLAGALGRAGDVEHVVEELEGEPDAAPEGAQRRNPAVGALAGRLEHPERARRLEQARGLQLAAAQVALDRHVRVEGVSALEQLALARAPSRRGRAPGPAPRCAFGHELPRTRRRTAGRRSRSPPRGPRPPPPSRDRGAGRPRRGRRRGRASREWTSSTAAPARTRPSPSPSGAPAATSTSSGRRRLPPAAIVEPACSASPAPWAAATSPRRPSTRSSRTGTCAPAASTIATASGSDGRHGPPASGAGLTPTCSAMMPPAVRT